MDTQLKTEVKARLATAEGHIRGIARMVDEDAYCVDIIKQILAVQRALDRVNAMVLNGHLHTCVTTAIRGENPDERERVIGELMDIFELSRKL
jgi:DNA-binding FrmR family transcriptional regulator